MTSRDVVAEAAKPRTYVVGLFILASMLLLGLVIAELVVGSGNVALSDALQAPSRPQSLAQIIIETIRLPRAFAAVLVGAALATAGVVMQTVLRNPLAAPDILAVTSGAQLALIVVSLLLPFAFPGFLATILGGAISGGLCLLVGGGLRAQPVRLALAGVAISLALSALSSAIVLMADDRASGVLLWSSGLLEQSGWTKIVPLAPAIIGGILLLTLLGRQFDVMALGNDMASGLGLGKAPAIVGLLITVVLSGAAVSIAGPIGFIGLAVPNFLRALGFSKHGILLPTASLLGAVALLAADVAAQLLSSNGTIIPTGILPACFAAPVLILVLRRIKGETRSRANIVSGKVQFQRKAVLYPILVGLMVVALLLGLFFGDGVAGWQTDWDTVYALRLPRVLIAMGAGALLACAGLLLQLVTRNPLSGPETLGLSQGAALAGLAGLLIGVVPGSPLFALLATLGACLVVLVISLLSTRMSPERTALTGIAVAASLSAVSTVIVIEAKLQVAEALSWLAGSTHGRNWQDVAALAPWLALIPLFMMLARWFDILAMGRDEAESIGLNTMSARIWTMLLASLAVAGAVATVGAIGFVGLIAPHAARLCSGARYRQLVPVTALMGAILTAFADMIGRTLIAPHEIPAGIVTAFIGAPLFILLMRHQSR
ncbi:iron ABC transporter permease [Brucella pecoris]|uniref:Iron ABC transporter permease n=1 Tax=Brucella pecoris TaxID=867683 RepID=A0A5C5CE36_9HYPH|nr:iron ABC transporter permease [Brucella pecoris]MBB4096010.1 iron complex transport system permease protein [Brucella pecoris]TNV09026.1 iron ABC transporter permease [Brucella pecoris]